MQMLTVAMVVLLKTIPIGGEGRWDYICVDPAAQRLFGSPTISAGGSRRT